MHSKLSQRKGGGPCFLISFLIVGSHTLCLSNFFPMPLLMLKDLPRYECILEASQQFPDLDPTACEAYLHLLRAGDDVLSCDARQNLLKPRAFPGAGGSPSSCFF